MGIYACECDKHLNSYTKNIFDNLILTCEDKTLKNIAAVNTSSSLLLTFCLLLLQLITIVC